MFVHRWTNHVRIQSVFIIGIVCAGLSIGFTVHAAQAQGNGTNVEVLLRQSAIESGYTVKNTTGTVALGIQPKSIQGVRKTRVRIRKKKASKIHPHSSELVSDIYVYKVGKGTAKKVSLTDPVWVTMSYAADAADKDKQLKYWNSKKKEWRKIRSSDDTARLQVTGQLHRKAAMIGVFTKPTTTSGDTSGDIIEGKASWYDGSGAANNNFPIGSRIRVTNTANGAFVDATIVSTGPFIPGRVVDLNREDFSAIANLSTGVINVTVQQIQE